MIVWKDQSRRRVSEVAKLDGMREDYDCGRTLSTSASMACSLQKWKERSRAYDEGMEGQRGAITRLLLLLFSLVGISPLRHPCCAFSFLLLDTHSRTLSSAASE